MQVPDNTAIRFSDGIGGHYGVRLRPLRASQLLRNKKPLTVFRDAAAMPRGYGRNTS